MAVSVLFTIRDEKGARSLVEIYLPSATTIALAQDFVTAVAPLLEALITGAIERVGICVSGTLPGGLRASPLANSDVEEGARFIFTSAGGYTTSVRIPTFDDTLILEGTNIVDSDAGAVTSFVAGMTAGLATVQPTDYRSADITALKSAREDFQRSRKRVGR